MFLQFFSFFFNDQINCTFLKLYNSEPISLVEQNNIENLHKIYDPTRYYTECCDILYYEARHETKISKCLNSVTMLKIGMST